MARYGTMKYGAGKYGSTLDTSRLTWILEVDWDNDGSYNGDNEAIHISRMHIKRGRNKALKSGSDGFETVTPGTFTATLNNLTRRYDPYNSNSPIYPNVLPGCRFRLRVKVEATETIYPVMSGYIQDIQPNSNRGGIERAVLKGVDAYDLLQYDNVISSLETNIAVEDAIQAILTSISWDYGSNLEESNETLPYWWASGKTASKEIETLVDAVLGKFFIAADGKATFLSRLRGHMPVISLNEFDIQVGIELLQPWETIRNDIDMIVRTRNAQASGDLWTLGDKPLVGAGKSLTVWAEFRYNGESVPAINVINPTATIDYLMNSAQDGSGTNLTSNFTVNPTIYADRAKLEITNSGSTDGYIRLLKIRGQALTSTPTVLNRQDSTSISRYRRRRFAIDGNWRQEIDQANDVLIVLTDYLSGPQAFPAIRLRNIPEKQFEPDLFNVVSLNFPSKDIQGNYVIGEIEHQWLDPLGELIETTFRFEPELGAADDYWIFTAKLGITTRLAG